MPGLVVCVCSYKEGIKMAQSLFKYRFAFRREYLDGNWLTGLSPKSIYIGYRMPKEKEDTIYSYCVDRRIPLFRYTPDFHSESSKKYYREVLYSPKHTGSDFDENTVETTE